MPCFKTFGCINREVRKFDLVYTPHQYLVIICGAKIAPRHVVTHVKTEDILEVPWWPPW